VQLRFVALTVTLHITKLLTAAMPLPLITSGYATMVHGRGCNLHRCTTTFANVEITSL